MRHIQTDILVIGGGATGTGVLRDLAMRGFKCILLESRDLAYGTTGRYHGLLHSGGRYVVKDPQAARECYEENQILRRILPTCIEDTGGYFVLAPQDDPNYVSQFLDGCRKAGIPTEPVPIGKMLKEEPLLNREIKQCYRVPDASADSFLAAQLNADSAREYGAQVLTYHEVKRLLLSRNTSRGMSAVTGAECYDLVKDDDVQIDASMVVNAAGAWAGIIAHSAGINLEMVPGKGTMLALNHRIVNTVINRCKPPSDGDILVPAHSVAVMGTTDIRVADPDHYSIEPWEICMLLDEGEKIIPQFKQFRILRAWAGVRPLVKEISPGGDREISRAFVLLDHARRDKVAGLITITSGKWTTYRKMAQGTVDKVCEKLGVERPCRTHLEVIPEHLDQAATHHYLGARLAEVEDKSLYGKLICECELVTRHDLEQAIAQGNATTLDDVRRHTRLGMGPCQGAFCTFRAAGIMHTLTHPPVSQTNGSLRDFLQERWKGLTSILTGHQLRQARFNELIYIDAFNTPALPGDQISTLAASVYSKPAEENLPEPNIAAPAPHSSSDFPHSPPQDVIVIGAGLAGLVTAWRTAAGGQKTSLITRGWGATYWNTGCIDIIGYQPPDFTMRVDSPAEYLANFIPTHPNHPYAIAGLPALVHSVDAFLSLCQAANYPYHGSLEQNFWLPTALGTLRPTCLVPETMIAGTAADHSPMLIVGFDQFLDFQPGLIADNLNAQGFIADNLSLDLAPIRNSKFVTSMVLAGLFDSPDFRQEVISTLKPKLGHVSRVGFPAVLGLRNPMAVLDDLQSGLGLPVFEIPGLPPSIPGIRLHNILLSAIEQNHGLLQNGMTVSTASIADNTIQSIWSDAAARLKPHFAKNFVLATGGFLGGGFIIDHGYAQETIFNLQVPVPKHRSTWFNESFLSNQGHAIFSTGILTDSSFMPIECTNHSIYKNLFVAGGALGGCDPIRERSLEGIALATGYKIGQNLVGYENS